jgi:hypothetical protein
MVVDTNQELCIPYKSRHIKNKIFVLFLLSYYLSETRVEANLSYHPEIINFDDFPILKGHNSSSESATTMNIKPVPGTFTRLRSCIVPAEITEPPKISGGQNHKYDGR